MTVYVVLKVEADSEYYLKDNHDPDAICEITTPVRVFSKRPVAQKFIKDNESIGVVYDLYEMEVRE